jgi:outer membrane protein assembly factor BamB
VKICNAFVGLILLSGCSTLTSKPAREFVFEKLWIRDTHAVDAPAARGTQGMSPALTTDLVIAGNTRDGLVAYKRSTGAEQWRVAIRGGVSASAQIVGALLYVGGNDGQFYCIEAGSGRIVWNFPLRAEGLAAPLIENGKVFVLAGNNTLYALAADSGKQVWAHSRTETTPLSVRTGSRPTLFKDILYTGFSDGYLVALNAGDGSVVWERQLNNTSRFRDVDAAPVLDADRIYISSFDTGLFALSRADGQVIWRNEEGGVYPVTIDREMLYFSSSLGHVMALNKSTGKEIWKKKLPTGIATQPVLYRGMLLYGESQGPLRAVRPQDGTEITHYDAGRGISSNPIIDFDRGEIFFSSNQGNLYVLKLSAQRNREGTPWQSISY